MEHKPLQARLPSPCSGAKSPPLSPPRVGQQCRVSPHSHQPHGKTPGWGWPKGQAEAPLER